MTMHVSFPGGGQCTGASMHQRCTQVQSVLVWSHTGMVKNAEPSPGPVNLAILCHAACTSLYIAIPVVHIRHVSGA